MAILNRSVAAGADDADQRGDGSNFSSINATLDVNATTNPDTRFHVGLRFQNITIPPGSIINSATLTVNVSGSDDPLLTVRCEDADNPSNFSTNPSVINRTQTTAGVSWNAENIGVGLKSPSSIAAPIQEVIDRVGWASGNAIVVLLLAGNALSSLLNISSIEDGTPATLSINYTPTSFPGGGGGGQGGGQGRGGGRGGGVGGGTGGGQDNNPGNHGGQPGGPGGFDKQFVGSKKRNRRGVL